MRRPTIMAVIGRECLDLIGDSAAHAFERETGEWIIIKGGKTYLPCSIIKNGKKCFAIVIPEIFQNLNPLRGFVFENKGEFHEKCLTLEFEDGRKEKHEICWKDGNAVYVVS